MGVTQRKDLVDERWGDEVGGLGHPLAASFGVLAQIVKSPRGPTALVKKSDVTGIDAPVIGMHGTDGNDGSN